MNNGFWGKLNKPFTVLAPMANVTDWAFRQMISGTGRPDVFYTEFISCDGICAIGPDKFKGELYFEKSERPIVVQFFTANPDHMRKCAELAVKMGFDGIDINMGCPDRSVEKQGAGASLIKNPKLAEELVKSAKEGSGNVLPISVKTRLGYNKIETDIWIPHLLEMDLATLVVHARTRKEMSSVPAHWDELGKISEMARGLSILIVGNGDIKDMADVRQNAKDYKLDGIMVGRGVFNNPWFFNEKINSEKIKPEERISLLLKHCDNFEKLWNPSTGGKNFDTLKRFFKIYIAHWPGAKELRSKLMEAKNISEVYLLVSNYKVT
ncbi:MAG: hypothetical protein A3B91_02675 [Candidatus Yanofskybacteria bacterium RIFCSPHIGHO2_02_FULL_41_29]|uniref:tRNA-dihydrouridine synthase n=1 Tax=Candidatus Yanofskybacteria bacterium RIFCSPHIGHO2_01_FULL_41_53 TaxID=1802663 RepID=A0A1F8ENP8_9BACT|nr:MAG: hypothetical protein A3I27_01465 [Candidatus Giovannonibacteria bacterium RIFCSPLOWO2_02_FULL_43_11b]OGN01950.1 MAG: hypothetical protein A2650_00115 [Candidatus Yanofskybacteria bacterium RIFCSPHIGHO2_01_FULL_41_53]OGN12043.1 MAG: hypothetical protein A3B91_02675 [Candidatus Yanofskybacteria bacterium RIFCSPHIGHO2_02_FULL_41_29]OGN21289.1 MAG: hypothetical protein A2916_00635 [Candidatus Yanofskybacteria bacterium RIFCSPLOWO2_01_FULL_41_67]OGN35918.1 MAG: hypothetical protein A3F98_012